MRCSVRQATVRSKQYRRIALYTTSFDEHGYEKQGGYAFGSPDGIYYDVLDKDGIFIKTSDETEWDAA